MTIEMLEIWNKGYNVGMEDGFIFGMFVVEFAVIISISLFFLFGFFKRK